MLDRGLEIVAYALKLRQSHLLPAGASPEAQAAQAEAWTSGTAYAALLHYIGKIAVDLHVEQADGLVWHPWHGPLLPGFLRAPYGDISAVRQAAEQAPDIVAVLIESVQGEGGIRVDSADYLRELRALCVLVVMLICLSFSGASPRGAAGRGLPSSIDRDQEGGLRPAEPGWLGSQGD